MSRPKITDEQITRILELHELGWSYQQIAHEIGFSRMTVYRYVQKAHGLCGD